MTQSFSLNTKTILKIGKNGGSRALKKAKKKIGTAYTESDELLAQCSFNLCTQFYTRNCTTLPAFIFSTTTLVRAN